MLPELEKIIVADRKARAAVDQARQEAEALLSEIRAKLDSLKTDLDQQIEHLKKTTEARAADITEGTHRYVDKLTGQAQSREEEALSFLVSQVLAG
jgi:F0F1-type ATP synthase membrane subunit b/b'